MVVGLRGPKINVVCFEIDPVTSREHGGRYVTGRQGCDFEDEMSQGTLRKWKQSTIVKIKAGVEMRGSRGVPGG